LVAAIANRFPHIVTPRRVNASASMITLIRQNGAADKHPRYPNHRASALRRTVARPTQRMQFALNKFDLWRSLRRIAAR